MGRQNSKEKRLELDEDGIYQNDNYLKYYEQKLIIKSKYPDTLIEYYNKVGRPTKTGGVFDEKEHQEFKKYIKEILNLMLAPDSHFQNFLWDITSDSQLILMERRARGRKKYDLE